MPSLCCRCLADFTTPGSAGNVPMLGGIVDGTVDGTTPQAEMAVLSI